MKDQSYRQLSLGPEVYDYLTFKRKRLTDAAFREYESTLDKLVRYHPELELSKFEPPEGTWLLERMMNEMWGSKAPRTYNKNLTVVHNFFEWAVRSGRLHGDPTLPIERAKARQVHRTTFTDAQRTAILSANPDPHDSVPLRLLLDYGIRKGALQGIRFRDLDAARHRLTVFTKGEKVHQLPIPDDSFWTELERLVAETAAQPDHYLLPRRTTRQRRPPNARAFVVAEFLLDQALGVAGAIRGDCATRQADDLVGVVALTIHALNLTRKASSRVVVRLPDESIGEHGAHDWWYHCLHNAGIVAEGVYSGQRMHKARHSAGQRVLDRSGNLKAVQKLLGHASIQTTADTYLDWDFDQLAETLRGVITPTEPRADLSADLTARLSGRSQAPSRG